MRVGIIGAQGWLGAILGQRLLDQGIVAPQDLMVMTRGGPGADYAGRAAVRWAENAAALVAGVDVIVAAVRPHDWDAVRLVAPDRLLISFMAGVGLAQLADTGARVVRAMPNAAAAIGASYTP